MYEAIKHQIYDSYSRVLDKKVAILWSGGPYSTLAWWIAYNDLNLRLPMVFVDNGDLPPALYAHVAKMRQMFKLEVSVVTGKLEDVIKELSSQYDVLISGKPIEGATCIIPEGQETWNYLKSLPMPFFEPAKRKILG